jgi:2-polyprenyl-6-methoxyphenol hydroxylase-like FAD-dependent oxidoreductase
VNHHRPLDTQTQEISIRNGATREQLLYLPLDGATEISIKKTKKLFSEGINVQVSSHWMGGGCCTDIFKRGKALTDIITNEDDTVTAVFQDGTQATGTTLVGAEGGGSITRRNLFGPEAEPDDLGYLMMNFEVNYTAEKTKAILTKLHPLVEIAFHPKGMYIRLNLLDVIDEWKPETTTFQVLTTWPIKDEEDEINDASTRVHRLKERMKDWAPPYRSAVEWLPDNFKILPDRLKCWAPKHWDHRNGRVSLAGDAAHAATFRKWKPCIHPLFRMD